MKFEYREIGNGYEVKLSYKKQKRVQDEVQDDIYENLSNKEKEILTLLSENNLSKKELIDKLGLKSFSGNFRKNLKSLMEKNLIEMTIPDKPKSKFQKYRKVK